MNNYLIEFIGTFFFIFVILYTKNALAIGAALAIVIMIGNGDYNPALTVVNFISGQLAWNDAIPIILAQVAGGLAALTLFSKAGKFY
jgi:glycerol uptake facilitator-like aquaporin